MHKWEGIVQQRRLKYFKKRFENEEETGEGFFCWPPSTTIVIAGVGAGTGDADIEG